MGQYLGDKKLKDFMDANRRKEEVESIDAGRRSGWEIKIWCVLKRMDVMMNWICFNIDNNNYQFFKE